MDSDIYTLPPEQTQLTEDDVNRLISEQLRNFNDPMKVQQGYMQSANFVSGSTGWQLSPMGAEINGGVAVQSLNIPNSTSANSFHVDTSGNTWWGSNVSTGYAGSNAYILNNGSAVFKNVSIGGTTVQYVITNSGIFSYGDGSDGTVTISANTTLSADKYYDTLTVNSGVTLNPGGYRIFVKNTLNLNGTIARNGNAGGNGNVGGSAFGTGYGADGSGAGTLADGYLKGSVSAASGSHGGSSASTRTPGGSGTATSNSLGTIGSAGGQGGNSQSGTIGGVGGGGGTATASNVKLIANWHLATLLDVSSTGATLKFNNSGSAGGGGGGGDDVWDTGNENCGGTGGGGGGSGGIVAVYARILVIGATGSITSNGGAGGSGGAGNKANGAAQSSGGGGGGGGGNGGIVILVYNQLTNGGSITANAGSGGTGGAGGPGASAGSTGTTGSAGTIYQFQLSL
jgi:hypothetical protein